MCVDGPWSGGYAGSVRSTAITIILELQPDVERGLLEQAQARGVSLTQYVEEIVLREAKRREPSERRTGQDLVDASQSVRGLLTDAEVDALFSRSPSVSRPVDLE